jgi:hypothetical protein
MVGLRERISDLFQLNPDKSMYLRATNCAIVEAEVFLRSEPGGADAVYRMAVESLAHLEARPDGDTDDVLGAMYGYMLVKEAIETWRLEQ